MIQRLAVLCPPHLCEQWQRELASRFHIPAVVIRSNTDRWLERSTTTQGIAVLTLTPSPW